jgi:uncharacterized protein (TIGR00369 family)
MSPGTSLPSDTDGSSAGSATPAAGAALIAEFLKGSPFVRHLDIRLDSIAPDRARLVMPFGELLVTIGDVVHGGAISTLVDTAAMTAAWSGAEVPDNPRGTTVGLSIDFVAAARGSSLSAEARVIRRGTSLCFCEVDVADANDALVAKALVTYKLG